MNRTSLAHSCYKMRTRYFEITRTLYITEPSKEIVLQLIIKLSFVCRNKTYENVT